MIKYNNFLNELYNRDDINYNHKDLRYENISEKKFIDLYKKHCSQHIIGNELYRGIGRINNMSDYMVVDPKK